MLDEKLIKLQHFFESDLKIKKEMYDMAPLGDNQYVDELSVEKYTDKINDSLIYMFSELKCIALDIFGVDSIVMNNIIMLEDKIKNSFYSCGFDIEKLRLFYKNCISNIEMDFIDLVKKECVGYS